jgi:hypothetical protein
MSIKTFVVNKLMRRFSNLNGNYLREDEGDPLKNADFYYLKL